MSTKEVFYVGPPMVCSSVIITHYIYYKLPAGSLRAAFHVLCSPPVLWLVDTPQASVSMSCAWISLIHVWQSSILSSGLVGQASWSPCSVMPLHGWCGTSGLTPYERVGTKELPERLMFWTGTGNWDLILPIWCCFDPDGVEVLVAIESLELASFVLCSTNRPL